MNNTVSLAPLSGCFIAHSRTKGSKNGVRLYQYEDGTYTELGKARRRVGFNRERAGKFFDQTIKGGKDKPNISPAEKIGNEAGNVVSETRSIERVLRKTKEKDRPSKHLSDEELKKKIARLELEKRYDSLTAEDVSRGKLEFDDIMSIIGSTLAIGISAAKLYATIKSTR